MSAPAHLQVLLRYAAMVDVRGIWDEWDQTRRWSDDPASDEDQRHRSQIRAFSLSALSLFRRVWCASHPRRLLLYLCASAGWALWVAHGLPAGLPRVRLSRAAAVAWRMKNWRLPSCTIVFEQ